MMDFNCAILLLIFLCVRATALGLPSDPEVNKIMAVSMALLLLILSRYFVMHLERKRALILSVMKIVFLTS